MFKCSYCEKAYQSPKEAHACKDSHDLLYIPIARSELNRLVNYILIPDPKLLEGTSVIKVLFKYSAKGNRV